MPRLLQAFPSPKKKKNKKKNTWPLILESFRFDNEDDYEYEI